MKSLMLSKLMDFVLPLLIGFIVPPALDALKRASSWLDNAAPSVKQTLAFVIAGIATMLAQMFGITVPTDLAAWDAPLMHTIIAGLLGIAIKQQKQVKSLKANSSAIPPIAAPYTPPAPDSPFHIPPDGAA
jgi:uncharacterized Tic20 family protein